MRSRRDRVVDMSLFLFAVIFSVVTADSVHLDESMSGGERIADQVAGGLACAAVFLRRRWPVHLAVALMLAGTCFHHLTGAMPVALFTVAVHRRRRVTAWVAMVVLVQFVLFLAQGPDAESEAAGSALAYFALVAGSIGWGLYVRYRRALIASLEERAARAAEEARRQAREEMAREMHDVLQLHHREQAVLVLAEVQDADCVRVAQVAAIRASRRKRAAGVGSDSPGSRELDGHRPGECLVGAPPDLSHRASPDRVVQSVPARHQHLCSICRGTS